MAGPPVPPSEHQQSRVFRTRRLPVRGRVKRPGQRLHPHAGLAAFDLLPGTREGQLFGDDWEEDPMARVQKSMPIAESAARRFLNISSPLTLTEPLLPRSDRQKPHEAGLARSVAGDAGNPSVQGRPRFCNLSGYRALSCRVPLSRPRSLCAASAACRCVLFRQKRPGARWLRGGAEIRCPVYRTASDGRMRHRNRQMRLVVSRPQGQQAAT